MEGGKLGVLVGILAVPGLVLGTVFSILLLGDSDASACDQGGTTVTIDPAAVPDTTIAGYGHEQLVNAAYIIEAGKALNLSARDQTIGVMTAMGESSLRVVDHGDAAGPDSRGLFQQRDNGAWGSYEDRMDPYASATSFFKAMSAIEGREGLAPTIVAHRTQRNADPYHYEKYWEAALEVVEGLAGIDTGLDQCATTPGDVNPNGWAAPAAGPVRSAYGMRFHPVDKEWRMHSGVDLRGGGCDGPIWAVQDGTVTFTGFDSVGNGTITIDHGGGVQTSYLHEYASGILVHEGDSVSAGQQIGRVGSSGKSTGCHLHFAVTVNGSPTDPVPFLAAVGIKLG